MTLREQEEKGPPEREVWRVVSLWGDLGKEEDKMTGENTPEKESIAKTLARFVHDLTYDDLPERVRELAKTRILDALSAAYAGRDLPHSRTAMGIAKKSPGDSTIFGCER